MPSLRPSFRRTVHVMRDVWLLLVVLLAPVIDRGLNDFAQRFTLRR
jgi:hypothetical protein